MWVMDKRLLQDLSSELDDQARNRDRVALSSMSIQGYAEGDLARLHVARCKY